MACGRAPLRSDVSLRCDGNPAKPHSVLRFKHAKSFCGLLPLRHGFDLPRLPVAFYGRDGVLLQDGPHPLPPGGLPGCHHSDWGETGQGGEDDHRGGDGFLHKLSAVSPHQDYVPGDTHVARGTLRDEELVLNHLQEHPAVCQYEQLSGSYSVLLHTATLPAEHPKVYAQSHHP